MSDSASIEARRRSRPAAFLLVGEVVVLAILAIWMLIDGLGGSSGAARVIGEAVTVLVTAALGGLIARGLVRANGFARTPAFIWHVLVALVGIFVGQHGQPLLGGIVAIAGVVGLVLTARVPHADL